MFERSCLQQYRLFTFVRHYASREVSCGMLTKVCRALINYLKLLRFLHFRSRCDGIFSQHVAKDRREGCPSYCEKLLFFGGEGGGGCPGNLETPLATPLD